MPSTVSSAQFASLSTHLVSWTFRRMPKSCGRHLCCRRRAVPSLPGVYMKLSCSKTVGLLNELTLIDRHYISIFCYFAQITVFLIVYSGRWDVIFLLLVRFWFWFTFCCTFSCCRDNHLVSRRLCGEISFSLWTVLYFSTFIYINIFVYYCVLLFYCITINKMGRN